MRVGLFVTCLADLNRPSVALATLKLLEQGGHEVVVPAQQTCCGQPALNGGHRALARQLAQKLMAEFADCDCVVLPSGSCAATLRLHYAELFEQAEEQARARQFGSRVYELSQFLTEVAPQPVTVQRALRITYHDSCSGLRELGIQQQPRALLQQVAGLELQEMHEADQCCGFGGTFALKYGELSCKITDRKCSNIEASGADMVVGGDLGCLMNMEGRLRARGSRVQVRHFAELLVDGED